MLFLIQRARKTSLHAFFAFPHSQNKPHLLGLSHFGCGFRDTMEGLGYFYTPHRTQSNLPSSNLLQPVIHIQVTGDNDPRLRPISPAEVEDIDREILSLTLQSQNKNLQMDPIKESESSSVMDQADGIGRMRLDSGAEPPLNKPIRSYMDESLPDLLRSGSPLRRRVSSPVSDTLKQMRKEVDLTRKRSLKLKAQVDKLQGQSHDGLVWSQNRERITDEIRSIVKLLQPLTDFDPKADPPSQSDQLDTALHQLKNMARALALDHTSNGKNNHMKTEEDVSVLQQALRDRDDALEKKKAMESELLKCKTELMLLNNHLLEAVQRRLEMAIELEAWKDDVQTILNHQLLSQQQAEQAQKKPRGFAALRRNKQPSPAPSPTISRSSSPASHSPNTPVAQRWKEKLRRGRASRLGFDTPDQAASPVPPDSPDSNKEDSFQNVSLD